MTPLKQRNRHRPEEGIWGDCHRAAIASILDLPLDMVPHFGDGNPDGDTFFAREREFLLSRGIVPLRCDFAGKLEDVLRTQKWRNPGVYYLLGGESKNGVNHTVVCFENQIIHDPSLDDSGIVGPCDSGFYELTFFGHILAGRFT